MIYQTFAQLYDELFDPEMYDNWRRLVETEVPEGGQILDLAGGAGRLAVLLAQKGYQVTDADFSPEMLTLADQHRQVSGVDIKLIETDMRKLEGLPVYDAVTCFADSLCYLPNLEAVEATFRAVKAHLKPGGKFLFDVITPYQTDEVYPGYTYNFEAEDHSKAFLWTTYADEEVPHGVIHDLAFFIQNADQTYNRVGETHFERAYELETLKQALVNTGFKDDLIKVKADFGRKKVQPNTTRWFWFVTN